MQKFKNYTIDFTEVKNYVEMHTIIRDSLDFPDYYGGNWDAFWDCLTDMTELCPLCIEIIGLEVIERKFGERAEKMLSILKKFKHWCADRFSDEIKIIVVTGDTRTELS